MSLIASSKCGLSGRLKRARLLAEIRDKHSISRQALSKKTGLSMPVVSKLTKQLIKENLIEETPSSTPVANGRPPIGLSLNRSAKFFIGVDVGAYETKCVLTNMTNDILNRSIERTPIDPDGSKMLSFLRELIRKLVADGRIGVDSLHGIMLSSSGLMDPEAGKAVLCCNIPSMRNLEITKFLEKEFKVPVHLNTSCGVRGIAEYEKARANNEGQDFMIVNCSYGLSIMPLIDQKVPVVKHPKGKMDFGHVTYDRYGQKCNCGSRGCLEAYASGWAIERDARNEPSELLLDLVGGDVGKITAKEVFEAAIRGDRGSLELIYRAGTILGGMLANFIQYYGPERVVFSGKLVTNSSIYLDAVIDEIRRVIPADRYNAFKFQVTSMDEYSEALGSTLLLAHDLLQSPLDELVRVSI